MRRERTLRLAVAQIPITADIGANVVTICDAIARAAACGADLTVFPETAISGYSPAIGHGRRADEWPAIKNAIATVQEAARTANMGVVVGTDAWDEDAWVNRVYALGKDGSLLQTYDKVHLMRADTLYYRAGVANTLFEFEGVCCGLQICYDARFPEGYRDLLHQGAEIILQGFYGAGSGLWKIPVLDGHLRSRAAESGCFLAVANVSGPGQIVVSQIVDPMGLLLAACEHDVPGIAYADVDLMRVQQSEIRADYFERFQTAAVDA